MEFFKLTVLHILVLSSLLAFVPTTSTAKSKYTDETRPYKFGFDIKGQQHRKEMKDENGIIMGEFGFITADDVYHVTVYATDENGNFKIISMKNIRLGEAPNPTPKPLLVIATQSSTPRPLPPSQQLLSPPALAPVPVQKPKPVVILTTPKPSAVISCSHCKLPNTTPPPPPQPQYNEPPSPPSQNIQTPFQNPGNQQYPNNQQEPQYQQQQPPNQQYPIDQQYQQNQIPSQPLEQQQTYPIAPNNKNNYQKPADPVLISVMMRPVDASAINTRPLPGEQPGLPPGISVDDMYAILYKFNYTLGFHGHYEEGYVNGFKKGEYYVNHRNGIATKVSYTADDKGFHPKISTVRISDIETPHEHSEKNDEFGLKGYEFHWFNVPRSY